MRRDLLPTLLVAAGCGALAGYLAAPVAAPLAGPARSTRAAVEPAASDPEGLEGLAAEVLDLRLGLERLAVTVEELARPTGGRGEGPARVEQLEALRDELLARLASGAGSAREDLETRVVEALDAVRRREAAEQQRVVQAKLRGALDQEVESARERLALTPYQSGEYRRALEARAAREEELRRAWEAGASGEEMGRAKVESRSAFERDLEAFLAPDQLDLWRVDVNGRGAR